MKLPEIKVNMVALIKFVINIFKWKKKHFGYRMGKKAAKHDPKGRTLKMAKYMAAIPDPPESFDNLELVAKKTGINDVRKLYPMLGNNRYGNCVTCGDAHLITVTNGRVGEIVIPTEKEVVNDYTKQSGCCKDNGLVMLNSLKYRLKHPLTGHTFRAFGRIDPKDYKTIKQCIWLFGGIKIGFLVQKGCIEDFEAGKVWQPGESQGGGHCVDTVSYTPYKFTHLTWGDKAESSYEWFASQVDECFVVLPEEAFQPGFAEGFDSEKLQSDFIAATTS